MHNNISHKQSDQDPLYLTNFISFPYQSSQQDLPVTQFIALSPFSVKWSSNGTGYKLYANGNPNPIYTGTGTSFDMPQGFRHNTTLMLEASNTTDTRYAFLTIIISKPTLTPDSMTVAGKMENPVILTVQGTLYAKNTLTINGVLNLGNNSAFNNITVSQTSNIRGKASLEQLKANAIAGGSSITTDATCTLTLQPNAAVSQLDTTSVSAPGSSNINDLTVKGNLTAGKANIAMIGSWNLIMQGTNSVEMTITAKTDGLVMIYIDPTNCNTGVSSTGVITCNGQQYSTTGANFYQINSNNTLKYGYCCVPIQKGSSWKFSGSVTGGGQTPVTYLYWIPFGANKDSYEITSVKELAGTPPRTKTLDLQEVTAQRYAEFLQTLAEATHKTQLRKAR
ncbi:hypothetical protein ACTJJB_30030 [Chitinophaga sp. 22536]|uniref:hypothetical protein n=1 Tax=unclassified Chitinophaga TaxID=2619133 RepID=UPI003F86E307